MKKLKRKALEKKLHRAIENVLKDNKAELKNKTEKAVNKSIRRIAKNTDIKKISVTIKKNKKTSLNGVKIKPDVKRRYVAVEIDNIEYLEKKKNL